MIHEVDYKGLTVIENKNNIYRYKCNNNCNLAHLPSVTKIKSCSNCLGTSGTSGNINLFSILWSNIFHIKKVKYIFFRINFECLTFIIK